MKILDDLSRKSGAKILCALKAFSSAEFGPLISKYLAGTCASGLYEARLAKQFYGGELVTYCAAFKHADMAEIIALSDHLIFNSPQQKRTIFANGASIGQSDAYWSAHKPGTFRGDASQI